MLELMVALAVAAILTVIAAPGFRDLMRRNDVSAASNEMLADLSYARSEAITRGTIVSICPSTDGSTCNTDLRVYDGGWLIYTYAPGHSVAATAFDGSDTTTNLLLRKISARDQVSMQMDAAKVISFGPQGQTLPTSSTYTFWTCFRPKGESSAGSSYDKVPGAQLTVNGSGSVSSMKLGNEPTCQL